MKNIAAFFTVAGLLCAAPLLNAGEGHHHDPIGGPKGGRLLENTQPQAEFFIENDNRVTITFYDNALKPVPAAQQSVVVIAEKEGVKTNLEFEKKGDALASKEALPAGEGYGLVVRFKESPDATPMNFRFPLTKTVCGECQRAEYACICGH